MPTEAFSRRAVVSAIPAAASLAAIPASADIVASDPHRRWLQEYERLLAELEDTDEASPRHEPINLRLDELDRSILHTGVATVDGALAKLEFVDITNDLPDELIHEVMEDVLPVLRGALA